MGDEFDNVPEESSEPSFPPAPVVCVKPTGVPAGLFFAVTVFALVASIGGTYLFASQPRMGTCVDGNAVAKAQADAQIAAIKQQAAWQSTESGLRMRVMEECVKAGNVPVISQGQLLCTAAPSKLPRSEVRTGRQYYWPSQKMAVVGCDSGGICQGTETGVSGR